MVSVASRREACVTIRDYGHKVVRWRPGNVAVGLGPFQVFAARASWILLRIRENWLGNRFGSCRSRVRRHRVWERQPLA